MTKSKRRVLAEDAISGDGGRRAEMNGTCTELGTDPAAVNRLLPGPRVGTLIRLEVEGRVR